MEGRQYQQTNDAFAQTGSRIYVIMTAYVVNSQEPSWANGYLSKAKSLRELVIDMGSQHHLQVISCQAIIRPHLAK